MSQSHVNAATKGWKYFEPDDALANDSGPNVKTTTNQVMVVCTVMGYPQWNLTADMMAVSDFLWVWWLSVFGLDERREDKDSGEGDDGCC